MEADEPSPASAAIDDSVKKKPKKKKGETTKTSNDKNVDPASPSTPAPTTMAMALPKKLSCRCVMTQDTHAASHRAGYTALVLDRRRGGLIAVTADHNLLLLEPSDSPGSGGSGGGDGSLSTKRQIVGYNDEVIDIKSLPIPTQGSRGGVNQKGEAGEDGESWVAVATNSPQVFTCICIYFYCMSLCYWYIMRARGVPPGVKTLVNSASMALNALVSVFLVFRELKRPMLALL